MCVVLLLQHKGSGIMHVFFGIQSNLQDCYGKFIFTGCLHEWLQVAETNMLGSALLHYTKSDLWRQESSAKLRTKKKNKKTAFHQSVVNYSEPYQNAQKTRGTFLSRASNIFLNKIVEILNTNLILQCTITTEAVKKTKTTEQPTQEKNKQNHHHLKNQLNSR